MVIISASSPTKQPHTSGGPVHKMRKLLPKVVLPVPGVSPCDDNASAEKLIEPKATAPRREIDVVAAAATKRLQYKMYQRRHRAKQREKAQFLELQVIQLHHEIARLEQTKKASLAVPCFTARDTLAGKPAQLVREYLRLFEHGYAKESSTQRTFVRSMMDHDVCGAQFQGVDELLTQWQLYGRLFTTVHLAMRQMRVTIADDLPVVHVSVTLALRMRKDAALRLFPCLAQREQLQHDLVRSAVTVSGSLSFGFDSACCVTRLSSEMDFVGGVLKSLGSFGKVLQLIENANIHLSTGYITHSYQVNNKASKPKTLESNPLTAVAVQPRSTTTGSPPRCRLAFILCATSATGESCEDSDEEVKVLVRPQQPTPRCDQANRLCSSVYERGTSPTTIPLLQYGALSG